jgi:hypothetical protein
MQQAYSYLTLCSWILEINSGKLLHRIYVDFTSVIYYSDADSNFSTIDYSRKADNDEDWNTWRALCICIDTVLKITNLQLVKFVQ